MIDSAPYYAQWQHLVAVHASLPRVPRPEEAVTEKEERGMLHGIRSGVYTGKRAEVRPMQTVAALDPDVLMVAGHTHEKELRLSPLSNTVNLDIQAETTGTLHGMYYPEMQFVSAEEPEVLKQYDILREYTDKKFVRDHLAWKKIFDAIDLDTMDIAPEKREELLKYNADNAFAQAALCARIGWMQEEYRSIAEQVRELLFSPLTDANRVYEEQIAAGAEKKEAVNQAVRSAVPTVIRLLKESDAVGKGEHGAFLGFLRKTLADEEGPEQSLARFALNKISERIDREQRARGVNAYWLTPADS